MTAKFNDTREPFSSIEFEEEQTGLFIQATTTKGILVSKEDLFELIGFLLRVQSNLKKAEKNGK